MAWFKDLGTCDYFSLVEESRLLAVGWLERGRTFRTGTASQHVALLKRLGELAKDPWQPVLLLGAHDCELCEAGEGPTTVVADGEVVEVGASNLFLPSAAYGVLVAPSLVLHYIRDHGYRPPDVFIEAVLECPEMRSNAYFNALRQAGGEGVMRFQRTSD